MHTLDDLRARFRQIGFFLTVVSAAMTGIFGYSMGSNWALGLVLAAGLMCATFASAYVWPFVAAAFGSREWGTFGFLVAFGVICTGTDLTTNFGSIAWQRTTDVDTALKQDAVHEARTDSVTEDKDALADARKGLAQLRLANPWATTVTADALRAQLPAIDEKLRQEERRGGCGPKCLGIKSEKAAIEGKIATAESMNGTAIRIADLEKRLEGRREVAVTTKKGESATRDMNLNLASMFTFTLEPTVAAQHWTNKAVAWLVAAFFTFGGMGCNFVGFGIPGRRLEQAADAFDDFIENMNRHIPEGKEKFAA